MIKSQSFRRGSANEVHRIPERSQDSTFLQFIFIMFVHWTPTEHLFVSLSAYICACRIGGAGWTSWTARSYLPNILICNNMLVELGSAVWQLFQSMRLSPHPFIRIHSATSRDETRANLIIFAISSNKYAHTQVEEGPIRIPNSHIHSALWVVKRLKCER